MSNNSTPLASGELAGLLMVAVSSVRYRARSSDEDLRGASGGVGQRDAVFRLSTIACAAASIGRVGEPKRVYRVYRDAGLTLRRKKRKHCAIQSAPLRQYTAANQAWALDFVHDAIAAGRVIRVLNVADAWCIERRSSWYISGSASPCRTRTWRASMGDCGKNACE